LRQGRPPSIVGLQFPLERGDGSNHGEQQSTYRHFDALN
jgi:hypothetical protein